MPVPSLRESVLTVPSAFTCDRPPSASHHARMNQLPPVRTDFGAPMVMAFVALCSVLRKSSLLPLELQADTDTNEPPPGLSASLMIWPNLVASAWVETMSCASPLSMWPSPSLSSPRRKPPLPDQPP